MFVREDLSPEQIAVQSCHACIEACKHFELSNLSDHPSVIILAASDTVHLSKIRKHLIDSSVQHVHFYEPDIGNELTALACQPVYGSKRRLFAKFQLLKIKGEKYGI